MIFEIVYTDLALVTRSACGLEEERTTFCSWIPSGKLSNLDMFSYTDHAYESAYSIHTAHTLADRHLGR